MSAQDHWNKLYVTKGERDVSWFEALPAVSLEMLDAAGLTRDTCVIDIGGGDSRLVDALVGKGLDCLAVLDVSGVALERAQNRLGAAAKPLIWIESDVTAAWHLKKMDIWHDRAVFHFLTRAEDRAQYRARLHETLRIGGSAILATFAPNGPDTCSGLPVAKYSPDALAAELGDDFQLVETRNYEHHTPWGALQPFVYTRFTKRSLNAPVLLQKHTFEPSVFSPLTVLTEAKRQKGLAALRVPPVCVLDPDGDIVRWLKRSGRGTHSETWACYHSDLYEFEIAGQRVGIVGCAVGAPYAVLVAEQMFVSGCELLISVTSAGQITPLSDPPYFVLITRALRDEGTSYHYSPASPFAAAHTGLLAAARSALRTTGLRFEEGATWTTDAPFRETESAISRARQGGILAVEMESAALYAFAATHQRNVLCFAHVTNTLGRRDIEFEKGLNNGVTESLRVIETLVAAGVGRLS